MTCASSGSWSSTVGSAPGTERRIAARCSASAGGQRRGELADGADVGDDPVAAGQVEGRGERHRAEHRHDERSGPPVPGDRERVDVLAHVRRSRGRGHGWGGRRASSRAAPARWAAPPGGRPRGRSRSAQGPRSASVTVNGRPATSDGVSTRSPTTTVCASSTSRPGHGPVPVTPGRAAAHRAAPAVARWRARSRWPGRARGCRRRARPTAPGRRRRGPPESPGRSRRPRRARWPAPGTASPCARTCTEHGNAWSTSANQTARSASTACTASSSAEPDDDPVVHRLDRQHVPRLAVRSGPADRQALALPDGERVRAVVLPEHRAGAVDDLARAATRAASAGSPGCPRRRRSRCRRSPAWRTRTARGRRPRRGSPPWWPRHRAGTSTARGARVPSPRARRTGPWPGPGRGAAHACRRARVSMRA